VTEEKKMKKEPKIPNKLYFTKIKNLCAKDTIKRVKSQISELEKIFANHETFTNQQTNSKMGNLNRHFSKDIQMVNTHMDACSC
jgi:hypothetical protein